ncbi:MAG: ATP-binding cassette domain-containing protein [Planctomycetes bacterium]|nr:ATP-binding cassette domain-containing protein [Planctomycetota bacterium]
MSQASSTDLGPLVGAELLRCGRHRPVLVDVTWRVGAGEFWCVLGDNGAGKSTLVATMLGLLPKLGGTVLPVCGGDRRRLGYVPQQQRFDVPLPITVAEFVALGLDDRLSRDEAAGSVRSALQGLGIDTLAGAVVQELSLGQQRRVLVARALARQPRLLVLDEPLANLDEVSARQLLGDLARLCREDGLALVLVVHDRRLAVEFASHVVLVAGGRAMVGSVAELLGPAAPGGRA